MNKKDAFVIDLSDEIDKLLQLDSMRRTRKAEDDSYQYIVSRVEETFSDQPKLKKQIMDILDNLNLSLEFAYMQVGMLLYSYTH